MLQATVWCSCLLLGCASSLPAPELVAHPTSAYVDVPYPPPAALCELVPPRPTGANLVWLDGEWRFQGQAYAWRRGGWIRAPEQARFAPPSSRYLADGRLQLAPGSWYDPQLRPVPFIPPVSPALTPANELTSEFSAGR